MNEYHIAWSGLGLETGYHYLIDVYNTDEQRILAWSNQQNKMELIYESTDKQKKELQYGLHHKISKDVGIWARVLNVMRVQKIIIILTKRFCKN